MRTNIAILSLTLMVALSASGADNTMTPDALVQRGIASYRAANYAEAARDLSAAAQALLSPEQMQNYVNSGKFPKLDRFETALVYLTLAESKLGHHEQARESVLRLFTAERIDASYAQLPLDADAAAFEAIAAILVPGSALPANVHIARGGAPAATATATTVAETAPAGPARKATPAPATQQPPVTPATTAAVTPPPPAPKTTPKPATEVAQAPPAPKQTPSPTTTEDKLAVQSTLATERAERQRIIDEVVAQERARIQKEADARIASERAAAERAADERIASDRVAAKREADERVASECAAAQRAADERIAIERASIQRAADERVAQAQKTAEAQVAAIQAQNRRNYLLSLRQADALAATEKVEQANQIYDAIVSSQDAPREIVAEAAVGLYRTGAFRSAANAFRKLAPYARGEEDLRYYNAVSLYETGDYAEAKKELACALPYIQITDEVTRYRTKIEQTPSRQASR